MAVIVVDVLRLTQTGHTARWFWDGFLHEKASVDQLGDFDGLGDSVSPGGICCAIDPSESAQG
jgi:hypothetical protein